MLILVCYDIPDDRKRERLAKELQNYGDRVQKSVFEVQCETVAQYSQLKAKIRSRIDPSVDNVRYYRLCAGCSARIEAIGSHLRPWSGIL